MCQQSLSHRLSSEDEDDTISSDEEGEHSARNLCLGAVAQDSPGMLVESFLDDEGPTVAVQVV